MKVIINSDFGGFGFSEKALEMYKERGGTIDYSFLGKRALRDDPIMVDIVTELGGEANAIFSDLEIVNVPEQYDYRIDDYDGLEHVVLTCKEGYLRELIRSGNEDEIVFYVRAIGTIYDEEWEDEDFE
jgi:hypothetical protein